MPNLVNRLLKKEYGEGFAEAQGMLVLSMAGVTVARVETFRDELAEKGVKLRLVRNALARRALAERGLTFQDEVFLGNVGIAWGGAEAAIHTAKVLTKPEYRKFGKIKIRAGVLEKAVLDSKDAAALAEVPDQITLRAQLVGCIQGLSRGLVVLLAAHPGGLARVLQAKVDKEGGVPAAT